MTVPDPEEGTGLAVFHLGKKRVTVRRERCLTVEQPI